MSLSPLPSLLLSLPPDTHRERHIHGKGSRKNRKRRGNTQPVSVHPLSLSLSHSFSTYVSVSTANGKDVAKEMYRTQKFWRCRALRPASLRCCASRLLAAGNDGPAMATAVRAAYRCVTSTPAAGSDGSGSSGNSGESGGEASPTARVGGSTRKIQVAVVGSGPSGCFVASYLVKKHLNIHVDLFERLPVAYGLCRYGVAPDHPEVRNAEKQFMALFKSGRVTWIGNVNVGKDIPVEAMLQHYAAVVFATGASSSKTLGIPGEELGGVLAARDVVSYYNTLPFPYGSPRFCPFDVARTSRVAIVGNGNVAVDVARVLAGSYKYFCETDMNCVALREFMQSRIRQIDVLGRRGAAESSFTIAEFRELTKYQEGTVMVQSDPFDLDKALAAGGKHHNARAHRRLMELVHKHAVSDAVMTADVARMASDEKGRPIPAAAREAEGGNVSGQETAAVPSSPGRETCTVRFRYHLAPVAVLPSATRKNYVGGLLCERRDAADSGRVPPAKAYCVVPCDLLITSVGYRSDRVPGVPFSEKEGVIPNSKGRVEGLPRVYCSGWVKNGAKGVILHSVVDAQETAASVLADIESGAIPTTGNDDDGDDGGAVGDGVAALPPLTSKTTTMYGKYGLVDYFVDKRLEPVSIGGLERILHVEEQRGIDLGKRAERVDSTRRMLDIALGGEVGRKTAEKVRGITPARADAMMYLKELLDDETDLAPLAHALAKDMPRKLAEQNPSGRIDPSQL